MRLEVGQRVHTTYFGRSGEGVISKVGRTKISLMWVNAKGREIEIKVDKDNVQPIALAERDTEQGNIQEFFSLGQEVFVVGHDNLDGLLGTIIDFPNSSQANVLIRRKGNSTISPILGAEDLEEA